MQILCEDHLEVRWCSFELMIKKIKAVAVKFKCSVFAQYHSCPLESHSNSPLGIHLSTTHQPLQNGQAYFQDRLRFASELIYDHHQGHYLQKNIKISINLISKTRPKETRSLGTFLADLASVLHLEQNLSYFVGSVAVQYEIRPISQEKSALKLVNLNPQQFNQKIAVFLMGLPGTKKIQQEQSIADKPAFPQSGRKTILQENTMKNTFQQNMLYATDNSQIKIPDNNEKFLQEEKSLYALPNNTLIAEKGFIKHDPNHDQCSWRIHLLQENIANCQGEIARLQELIEEQQIIIDKLSLVQEQQEQQKFMHKQLEQSPVSSVSIMDRQQPQADHQRLKSYQVQILALKSKIKALNLSPAEEISIDSYVEDIAELQIKNYTLQRNLLVLEQKLQQLKMQNSCLLAENGQKNMALEEIRQTNNYLNSQINLLGAQFSTQRACPSFIKPMVQKINLGDNESHAKTIQNHSQLTCILQNLKNLLYERRKIKVVEGPKGQSTKNQSQFEGISQKICNKICKELNSIKLTISKSKTLENGQKKQILSNINSLNSVISEACFVQESP